MIMSKNELKDEIKQMISREKIAADLLIDDFVDLSAQDTYMNIFMELSDKVATALAERSGNNAVQN